MGKKWECGHGQRAPGRAAGGTGGRWLLTSALGRDPFEGVNTQMSARDPEAARRLPTQNSIRTDYPRRHFCCHDTAVLAMTPLRPAATQVLSQGRAQGGEQTGRAPPSWGWLSSGENT